MSHFVNVSVFSPALRAHRVRTATRTPPLILSPTEGGGDIFPLKVLQKVHINDFSNPRTYFKNK